VKRARGRGEAGFALVLTLALLALLVLTVLALSVLVRTGAQVAGAAGGQVQARQHALLGLAVALGELQKAAGPDARVTAMAGMAGVPPQSPFRHWCGVWRIGGSAPDVWLTSGASPGAVPALSGETIVLVGPADVGNPSDRTDQELVEAGLVGIPGDRADGDVLTRGHFAYWVGDEGVKVSAAILDRELQFSGTSGTGLRPNLSRLVSANFAGGASANAKLLALEQLEWAAEGVSLTGSFHSLGLASRALSSSAPDGVPRPGSHVVGAFNLNTTAEAAWRAWLEFPDASASVLGLNATRTLSGARQIRDRWTARARPFFSVAEMEASGLMQDAFAAASPKITSVTAQEFVDELRPILTVRSDTFRIRAYGDVVVPATGARPARAWCEAIVQRTPEPIDATLGRRFVVTYFRWLGPEDI